MVLNSQNFYQNQRGRFTLSQSSPPVRNAMYLETFYFRIYSWDFVNQHVFFCCSIYTETAQTLWTAMLWKSHENVIKNRGRHFSGPWIQIFHFHGLFFRPWIFYEKLMMVFMAHEIAMKYLALGFMSHEKLVCYRFHGPWKLHSKISGVVKNEKW